MASHEQIIFTCDICPAEGVPESSNWKTPLPKNWVDLNVVANDGVRHSKHLCPKCYMYVSAALLEREAEINTNQE